jgi:hypothetical protein
LVQHDAGRNFQWGSHNTLVCVILRSSATSETVKRRLEQTSFRTFFLNVFFIFCAVGRCERSLFSVGPSLKHLYYSWVCVLIMASFSVACFNVSKVCEYVFPNVKTKFHTYTLFMKIAHS